MQRTSIALLFLCMMCIAQSMQAVTNTAKLSERDVEFGSLGSAEDQLSGMEEQRFGVDDPCIYVCFPPEGGKLSEEQAKVCKEIDCEVDPKTGFIKPQNY